MKTAMILLVLWIIGCGPSTGANNAQAGATAATNDAPAASVPKEAIECKYSFCSKGEMLYWFVDKQKNSLEGDTEWWEGNRSAEYENKSGHPTLVVGCRHSKFVQAQIKSDGILLESSDSIATVAAKADGKRVTYRWPISKDYQNAILDKAQFKVLTGHRDLILGLQDYHGVTYNLILQIPPFTPEMRASCSL